MTGLTRRRLVAQSLGLTSAAMLAPALGRTAAAQQLPVDPNVVPFYGTNQAGIVTPAQDRLAFGAFDLKTTRVDDLRDLLRVWTDACAAMTQGQPVPGITESPLAPPVDTGEAAGLGPSHLTITVGFGPSLFNDQLGLTAKRPAALVDLPPFPNDHLVDAQSGGDIGVQACADDPQVAFHAVRDLARLGRGLATLRWMQLGFGRTSTTSRRQNTPRNLMGFKDGTNNLKLEDADLLNAHLWVGDETDQPWMRGGSYLVTRRIRMRIESWDRTSLDEQERVFGRRKTTGAPFTGQREFDTVDLAVVDADGSPRIPVAAHVRLAAPGSNADVRILRRGYSFTDGIDALTGELDAGLFFICFQKDPRSGFIPVQRKLSQTDALNEYIRHDGSAVFACPPGALTGGTLGSGLFDQA